MTVGRFDVKSVSTLFMRIVWSCQCRIVKNVPHIFLVGNYPPFVTCITGERGIWPPTRNVPFVRRPVGPASVSLDTDVNGVESLLMPCVTS